jgi:hypothetical protein
MLLFRNAEVFFIFDPDFDCDVIFTGHSALRLARVLTGRGPGLSHPVPTVREG